MAYTAAVLTPESQQRLREFCQNHIPAGWKVYCHHMTINMGNINNGPVDPSQLNQKVLLNVVSLGQDDKVVAVGIETTVPSNNIRKHVTVAVGPTGKPKNSNDIVVWNKIQPFQLDAVIMVVE